jgi:hypothetical protein
MRVLPRLVAVSAALGVLSLISSPGVAPATAAPADIGHADQSYAPLNRPPTGSKPESKLWFNGGWWASMFNPGASEHRIYKLDPATRRWRDTGVALDTRASSRADTLWDAAAAKLYVASHVYTTSGRRAGKGNSGRVYRYSYDATTGRYALDAGFPVTINRAKSETLVIDKDSTGTLWATWTQGGHVYVNHSIGGDDAAWGAPYVVPGAGTSLTSDDISSVVHFGGTKIGVMWSNQTDHNFYFAVHVDGASDAAWTTSVVPVGLTSDDHINLKAGGAGQVFAAIKTGTPSGRRSTPLVLLLVRSATGGWSTTAFGTSADSQTRPIVLLDQQHAVVHMIATCPQPPKRSGQAGGDICEKTTPMSPLSFAPGIGTPILRVAGSPDLNDPTSTKQALNAATGLVVLATNATTHAYWTAIEPLAG